MKKSKKNIIKLLISIIIIVILITIIILFYPENEEKISKESQIENIIENVFFSDEVTKTKLESVTENTFVNEMIFWGEDSAIRLNPTSAQIKKYKLEKYVKKQNKYAPIVEKKIKSLTKYTIEETEDGNVEVDIKPWYYETYVSDMVYLSSKLLELSGYDVENNISTKDFDIYEYKSRVTSMEILNDYLDNYNNDDETIYFEFQFDNNENAKENEYFSLYCNLSGLSSKTFNLNSSDETAKEERINNYIEEAISKGIITKKNPLKL